MYLFRQEQTKRVFFKLQLCNKRLRESLAFGTVVMETTKISAEKLKFCRIGCSFKYSLKVGTEESIVNALQITDHGSAV
jgi:hypothetical protein